MIDPKVLLEALLAGAAKPGTATQQPAQAATAVDLGEVLRRLGGAQGGGGAQAGGGDGGGLADILEKLGRAAQQGQAPGGRAPAPQQPRGGQDEGPLSGGLGDILGEIFGRGGQAPQRQPETRQPSGMPSAGGQGGGDLLEEIFGKQAPRAPQSPQAPQAPVPQAPRAPHTPWGQGARPGGVVDARARAEELLSALAAGQGTPEMIAELQQMVANGQLNASAVIGGLGSVIVGNKPGRRINAEAVSIGGLELIGAVAYASYVGYQQDRGGAVSRTIPTAAAPKGSGFEPEAQSSDAALLYVRAMIAAAVADGEIDAAEQQKLIGGLQTLGLGQHAAQFLQQEIETPQSVEDLVQAATSPVQAATSPAVALQVYVAARLAIEPDTRDERAFLQSLAQGLGIDQSLSAHIDAQTTALKT